MTELLARAGRVELAFDAAIARRMAGLDVGLISRTRSHADAPEAFLPFLGWERSIDYWDPDLDVMVRRELVRCAVIEHYRKGTLTSLKNLVRVLTGSEPVVEENPGGVRFTANVEVFAADRNPDLQGEVRDLISDNKRLSVHLLLRFTSLVEMPFFQGIGGTAGAFVTGLVS